MLPLKNIVPFSISLTNPPKSELDSSKYICSPLFSYDIFAFVLYEDESWYIEHVISFSTIGFADVSAEDKDEVSLVLK